MKHEFIDPYKKPDDEGIDRLAVALVVCIISALALSAFAFIYE
jgi:hypothetical protein